MAVPETSALDMAAMRKNSSAAARLLKLLANAERLRVLCLLVEGELSVGQINARVELSASALSQHLAKLRDAGLVATRRDAQTIFYRLDSGPVMRLLGALHDIYCAAPPPRRAKTSKN